MQTVDPLVEQRTLALQVRYRVDGRVVEEGRDLLEREAELAVHQHPVQPTDVVVGVHPVARVAAGAGRHEADLVVVVQRAHTHADQRGNVSHRAPGFPVVHCGSFHGYHRAASRRVRVKRMRVKRRRESQALHRRLLAGKLG